MPVNSIVNTPQNTTYFSQISKPGKGFKIIDSSTNLEEISNMEFDQYESNSNEFSHIGIGSSYFFESSQYKLNPCKTVLTKESLKQTAKSAYLPRIETDLPKQALKKKNSIPNNAVPSFSRFYQELKDLKKIDPNMRSKLSFTYFC